MDRLNAIREYLAALKVELNTFATRSEALSDTEDAHVRELLAGWDTLTEEAKPLEERAAKLEAVRAAALHPTTRVENANDGVNINIKPSRDEIYDTDSIRAERLDPRAAGRKFRDHAMRAIDAWPEYVTPEQKESAERKLANRSVSEHILDHSAPEYVEGFESMLRNPATGMALLDPKVARRFAETVQRAALAEGVTTTGGFLVPPFLDPTVILTNAGTTNPFRQISTVKTITTQTWKGVTSAGVTAEWTAEAAEATDASPTFAQPTITPIRADAYVQGSFEMVEDTNISGELSVLFADARDRLESAAFAVGTGSTQPNGIITAVSGVTASRVAGSSGAAGSADFVLADVYALANALPPRWRANSSWVAEQTILNKVRRFGEGVTANAAFWADLGVAIPSQLLGRPVYQSAEMDNTIVSGSNDDVLLIGDFRSGYYIVDRVGMGVAYNPLVIGANRRPTGEVGWYAFWRVGADAVVTDAFRLLRL